MRRVPSMEQCRLIIDPCREAGRINSAGDVINPRLVDSRLKVIKWLRKWDILINEQTPQSTVPIKMVIKQFILNIKPLSGPDCCRFIGPETRVVIIPEFFTSILWRILIFNTTLDTEGKILHNTEGILLKDKWTLQQYHKLETCQRNTSSSAAEIVSE